MALLSKSVKMELIGNITGIGRSKSPLFDKLDLSNKG